MHCKVHWCSCTQKTGLKNGDSQRVTVRKKRLPRKQKYQRRPNTSAKHCQSTEYNRKKEGQIDGSLVIASLKHQAEDQRFLVWS